jgi:HJR/Mrr/RecB family endonuclease
MARRRKNELHGFLGLALIAGTVWLLANAGNALLYIGGTIGAVVLVIVVIVASSRLIQRWIADRTDNRIRQSLLQKVQGATDQHLAALVRKRAQLVQPDAYGNLKHEKWDKEVEYFIEHLRSRFTLEEQFAFPRHALDLAAAVKLTVRTALANQPELQTFSNDMTPAEFEAFCADELRRAGWNARVTMQSRDQGIDVIADKNDVRVVLQCKLYTGPVGNKAVQEAAAGKAHEQAHYGIVVTNNRYTPAAEQLATTNGVLLLHYRDLRDLESILPNSRVVRAIAFQQSRATPSADFDRMRWNVLLQRDSDLVMVVSKLSQLGPKWADQFAASYLAVNDKNQLPSIVNKIIAAARIEYEQGQAPSAVRKRACSAL